MTQSLESLSRRTASMQGIRSIVHTMKTLSVINSAPYENAARSIEAYHQTVLLGLHAFLSQVGALESSRSARSAKSLIIFGSDHGMCGNYNEALASHVASRGVGSAGKTRILCVGAQMADALCDQNLEPEKTFFPPASVDGIGRLANILTRHIDDMQRDHGQAEIAVSLAYFRRDGDKGRRPELTGLLPLDQDMLHTFQTKPWASRSLPSFTMPAPALLQSLIRGHLFASLFRASAEALVTENAARLALMSQAEQSVDDRLEELLSQTRAVRQSEITTELLDVIIGFEALKKRRPPSELQMTNSQEGISPNFDD